MPRTAGLSSIDDNLSQLGDKSQDTVWMFKEHSCSVIFGN